tara:strand:+ start:5641 stop:6384 length:744 start_codon:yes stop_codon:yes gene_type:complete
MKAIIIAAGDGTRIAEEFKDVPKSLIPINGKTIFERQKYTFEKNNISEFIIITGPEHKFRDVDVKYIKDYENKHHDILGSLLVAKEYLKGNIIISYSDILFEEKIIKQLIATEGDIVIAIDLDWKKEYENRTEHPLSEAENVLINDKGQISSIKKNIDDNDKVVGEFLGLIKMTEKGSDIFLKKINDLQKNHVGKFHNAVSLEKGYLTDIIQEMLDSSIEITPLFISGKWCEVDTKQDLDRATKKFS